MARTVVWIFTLVSVVNLFPTTLASYHRQGEVYSRGANPGDPGVARARVRRQTGGGGPSPRLANAEKDNILYSINQMRVEVGASNMNKMVGCSNIIK